MPACPLGVSRRPEVYTISLSSRLFRPAYGRGDSEGQTAGRLGGFHDVTARTSIFLANHTGPIHAQSCFCEITGWTFLRRQDAQADFSFLIERRKLAANLPWE
jgi:hypothetical protein